MSQSSNPLSIEECETILQRWQKEGLTDEERNEYVVYASAMLTDSKQVSDLQERIRQSAEMAKRIDREFYSEEIRFQTLAGWYYPYTPLYDTWRGYVAVS